MPRPYDPRVAFGFAGQPLAVAPQAMPVPDQVRERFKRTGMEAFMPYVNVYDTIAQGQNYRRAATAMDVADAENEFVNEVGSGRTGFQEFLQKNPIAGFSPMVQAYQKANRTRAVHDPYEAALAREGSIHLDAYRHGLQAGMDPVTAFSKVRDRINAEKAAKQAKNDDELFFVQNKGDLTDLPALQAKGASRAQMLDFINKKGKPLGSTERTHLAKLQTELDEAGNFLKSYGDDEEGQKIYGEEAMRAFKAAHPDQAFDPKSKDDWDKAYAALKEKKVGPAQEAFDTYVRTLEENGMRIPGAKIAPAMTPATPASTPTAPNPVAANAETTAQKLLREARERRAGK